MSLVARIRPASAAPEGALVLIHGRGADENDLFPLLDLLDPERRLVGATPRGPLSLPPGGAHWYVLGGIGTPEARTFLASYAAGGEWLDGFLGEGRPRPAGLIALSSFMPTVDGFSFDLSPPLPRVAIGHGTHDNVIGVEWGRRARELLELAGADVLYRETPMFHQIDPDFLNELAAWLPATLAPRPEA